jgi:hypothetical protein
MNKIHTICLYIIIIVLALIYIVYKRTYTCNYNSNYLIEGKEFLSTKNVAICGLVRDNGDRINNNMKEVKKIASYFNDYRVLIVENDSEDDTRDILLDWTSRDDKIKVLGCNGLNLTKCKLDLPATIYHDTSKKRIKKMSYLRNIYLDELRKPMYNNIDYVIVWDLDLIAEFNINSIYNLGYRLKYNPQIDAICANGLYSLFYYDTYAFRLNEDDNRRSRKSFYDMVYRIPYNCNIKEDLKNEGLIKVKSCFGGFTIYKKSSILSSRYDTYLDQYGTAICEHEYLSSPFKNIYSDTKLQLYVYKN